MKKLALIFALLCSFAGISSAQISLSVPNDTTTGTKQNKLAKYNTTASATSIILMATTDTTGAIGIVSSPDSAVGVGVLTISGVAPCIFDNATTPNDFVQISSTTAGDCHDTGSAVTRPTSGQIIGTVWGAGGAAGTYNVSLNKDIYPASSSVTAPYVPISDNATTAVAFTISSNQTWLFAFVPKGNFTTTQLAYNVNTADNTANLYDLGIYNSSGTLLGHTGATAGTTIAPSTGNKNIAWLSSFSLTGGQLYFFAMTGNAGTFKLGAAGSSLSLYCGVNPSASNATSGGVLNSSVTPPSGAQTTCNFPAGIAW